MSSAIRIVTRTLVACAAVALSFVLSATVAGAVPAITEPSGAPFAVGMDAQGKPVAFTIAVSGFPAGSLVYVEQCDPRPPTSLNWLPTRDCDIGSSPAAAIVGRDGTARFPAHDVNYGFQVFAGLSPEGLFSCLGPNAPSLHNGLPEYRSCQIRVSSNNNQPTTDQVFLPIVFAPSPSAVPTTTAAAPSSHSSSGSAALIVGIPVALVAIAGVVTVEVRRRRRVARSA